MKLLSTLFFSSAVAFTAIGNAASETVAVGWRKSYTLETGKVLMFLHRAHDIELSSNFGCVEILDTLQGELILFSAMDCEFWRHEDRSVVFDPNEQGLRARHADRRYH